MKINGGTKQSKIATGQSVVQNRRIRHQRRRAPRIIKCEEEEEEEGNNNDTTTTKSRVPIRLVDDNKVHSCGGTLNLNGYDTQSSPYSI